MTRLEDDLQTMLRERAHDITTRPTLTLPAADGPTPVVDLGGHRSRRSAWLVAAAVIAVLALAGGLLAYAALRGGTHRTPPATHSPTVTPSATVHECTTTLPSTWRSAMRGSGSEFDQPFAVTPAGTMLVGHDTDASADPHVQSPQLDELRAITPGSATRTVFSVARSSDRKISGAVADGKYLVVGVSAKGPDIGGGQLAVVVLDSSTYRTLAEVQVAGSDSNGPMSSVFTARGGTVYWDLRPSYTSSTGTVVAYDIATGTTRVVYRGPRIWQLAATAAGVSWSSDPTAPMNRIDVPSSGLPDAVQAATNPTSRVTLATDGSRYAWFDAASGRIGWYGARRIRYVHGSHLPLQRNAAGSLTVVGPYVIFVDRDSKNQTAVALDIRTGAVVDLPDSVTFLAAAGSTLIGSAAGGKGSHPLLQVDAAGLTPLEC